MVEKLPEQKSLEIVGDNLKPEQVDLITKALARLPELFAESVTKAHLRDDVDHFEYSYNDTIRHAAAHHCGVEEKGKICIRTQYLTPMIVWHEAAHAYAAAIEHCDILAYEWVKIAGDVYDPLYEDYDGDPLSDGLLEQYGRKNHHEDIATWVENCYSYLYIDPTSAAFQNGNCKTDQRYRKKLACLKRYGFFSEADYQKLKPLFE